MTDIAKWGFGFLLIIGSGFVCFTLSVSNPDLNKMELGALTNFIMPVVSTIVGLILYLTIELIIKRRHWFAVSVSISLLNVFYGVMLFIPG